MFLKGAKLFVLSFIAIFNQRRTHAGPRQGSFVDTTAHAQRTCMALETSHGLRFAYPMVTLFSQKRTLPYQIPSHSVEWLA